MSINWELVDENLHTGLRKYIAQHPDDPEGALVRHEFSNNAVQTIIDRNKAAQAETWDKKADVWHAAHIPVQVMYEWLTKHGVDAWKYSSCEETKKKVNKLLNSSDYRYLRVRNFIMDTK